ncbi:MAG TPA: endonuclease/exonuclease/phosphatase family protein [Gemmataceae bacterium]|nr:endonuclease/exonuclease/phosphatase family protein [Gemmataceae bacterium]
MKQLRSAAPILATGLSFLALVTLLGMVGAAIYTLNSFNHQGAVGTVIGAALVCLVLGPRLLLGPVDGSSSGWRSRFRRLLGPARKALIVVLACWLGLIGWSKVSPGGPMPAPKTEPSSIRVVTWNILHGEEGRPPWDRLTLSNWPGRKDALQTALRHAGPDILCVQEACAGQVAFLEQVLPTHRRVGVGRDDGRAAGEHCAIYFDADRFEQLGGDTFWLEEPTDQPRGGSVLKVKRICTWVRLRDQASGRTFRVYNVHSYLTERSRVAAAQVVLDHLKTGDPADAIILAGDFNAPPGAPSRRLFAAAGLADSAEQAGRRADTPTYQWYGLRIRCLDGILVSPDWRVCHHRLLDVKPGNTYPSDHFGILADLAFRE